VRGVLTFYGARNYEEGPEVDVKEATSSTQLATLNNIETLDNVQDQGQPGQC